MALLPSAAYASDCAGCVVWETVSTNRAGIGTTQPVSSWDLSGTTDALALPAGTLAQRPVSAVNGEIRYNASTPGIEAFISGNWQPMAAGGSGNASQWVNGSGGAIYYNGGNVGIGTASPSAPIEIDATTTSGNDGTYNYFTPAVLYDRSAAALSAVQFGIGVGTSSAYNRAELNFFYTASGSPSNALGLGIYGKPSILYIQGTGNVGIGTTAPSALLDVYGAPSGAAIGMVNTAYLAARDPSGTLRDVLISRWSDDATYLDGGVGGIYLRTNNSTVNGIRIGSTGNVGVGNTAPTSKLNVTATTQFDGLTVQGNTTNWIASLTGLTSTNDNGLLRLYNSGTAGVYLAASGNSYLTGGNVGIGTNNPTATLHVTTASNQAFRVSNAGNGFVFAGATSDNGGGGTGFELEGNPIYMNGNVGLGTVAPGQALDVNGNSRQSVWAGNQNNNNLAGLYGLNMIIWRDGAFQFGSFWLEGYDDGIFGLANNTSSAAGAIPAGSSMQMLVMGASGNVCTAHTLSSLNTITPPSCSNTLDNGNGGAYFSNNVGIGTTSPQTSLQAEGTIMADSVAAGDAAAMAFGTGGSAKWYFQQMNSDSTNRLRLYDAANGVERISFLHSGNVGIGTTNPSLAPLQVAGYTGNTAAMFGSGSNGVSIIAAYPEICFNCYYSGGNLSMGTGYRGVVEMNGATAL